MRFFVNCALSFAKLHAIKLQVHFLHRIQKQAPHLAWDTVFNDNCRTRGVIIPFNGDSVEAYESYKKPTQLPAPKYVELLMDWIESQINNEAVFPVSTDVPFPKSFVTLCRKILTRLFRVFVHVYIHHFDRIVSIGAEAHVNTCYKHFYYFVQEFELIPSKELEPLFEMTSKICKDT